MKRWRSLMLAGAFLAGFLHRAWAVEVPPPPSDNQPGHGLTVTDEELELALRPQWRPKWDWAESLGLQITPSIRGGYLGLTETFPYPVLTPSPFGAVGLKTTITGPVEAAVMGSYSRTRLNTRKGIADPGGVVGSGASRMPNSDSWSQTWTGQSAYADLGKTVSLGNKFKMAFFAAVDAWSFDSGPDGVHREGLFEQDFGTVAMFQDGKNQLTLTGDVSLESGRKNLYRNEQREDLFPTTTVKTQYSRDLGGHSLTLGVEGSQTTADKGLRPYAGWSDGRSKVLAGVDFREGDGGFIPDVREFRVSAAARLQENLSMVVSAANRRETYGSFAPVEDNMVLVGLNWTPGARTVVKTAKRFRDRRRAREASRSIASWSGEMNGALRGGRQNEAFRNMLKQHATYSDFVKAIPVSKTDDILTAVSQFSSAFSDYNYNFNESEVPNVDDPNELYARARAAYLAGKQDPILVCIGSAQFTAELAESLGRKAGVDIRAAGVTVGTPDAAGRRAGHAVAMIRTPEYGIVFADWGKLTPTHTPSPREALRIYQALVGTPQVFHDITDASKGGRHLGYLFTEEGKMFLRKLTFHADAEVDATSDLFEDPRRGRQITTERYKNILEREFGKDLSRGF